ncbi:MAG TPA: SDR family oxidoreductase [Casimicrobiaceae bacterium]|nr:SDR family oxidoreductase [Casimicrobiaceae bacterium]
MNISDLSVVLTGASGGIGAATAMALVRNGARVLLVARSHDRLASLAHGLDDGAAPGQVEALAADVTTAQGRADIIALAGVRRVDTLIQCAGTPYFGALEGADDARIEDVLATNLIAPIQLVRALLPELRKQPQARILNVGSALGRLGMPGFAVYCASKFGLRGFTEALRRELSGTNVRVQYIAPRTTRTAFNDARVDAFNRATGTRSDPPHAVAYAIVRTLRDGAAERALGFPEKLAARVNGVAPRLLDRAFNRHRDAMHRGAAPTPSTLSEEHP